jgi:hypothetical protein
MAAILKQLMGIESPLLEMLSKSVVDKVALGKVFSKYFGFPY